MSARLQNVIKGLLSEGETDIASESDAKVLNRAQKHLLEYCIVYFVKHLLTITSGRVTK